MGLSGAIAIAAGGSGYQTCALLSGGTVECWGDNYFGQLGNGTSAGPQTCSNGYSCSTTPVAVTGLSGVSAIAAGGDHTCALVSGGTVDCWGNNYYGELGTGSTSGPDTCTGFPCSTAPVAVTGLSGTTAIAAGYSSTCTLVSGGAVDCWGFNEDGELGDDTSTGPQTCNTYSCSTTPVAVTGLSGATAIASGSEHTCALVSGGTVECWGHNNGGQLGNGTTTNSLTPAMVTGLSGATAVAAASDHTCALLSDGTVECWGDNQYGELGNGTTTNSSTPVAVLW